MSESRAVANEHEGYKQTLPIISSSFRMAVGRKGLKGSLFNTENLKSENQCLIFQTIINPYPYGPQDRRAVCNSAWWLPISTSQGEIAQSRDDPCNGPEKPRSHSSPARVCSSRFVDIAGITSCWFFPISSNWMLLAVVVAMPSLWKWRVEQAISVDQQASDCVQEVCDYFSLDIQRWNMFEILLSLIFHQCLQSRFLTWMLWKSHNLNLHCLLMLHSRLIANHRFCWTSSCNVD